MVGLFQNNMMLRRRNMMTEDSKIVIADDTKYGVAEANAPVVEIMYKKGWCKNEHYVTQGECNAITPSMIGDAFQKNTAIEHFDELKYFGSLNVLPVSMFSSCTELKRVTIPSGCKALNPRIFEDCNALETVNTQGNDFHATTTMNHVFYNCQKLKNLDTSNWKLSQCNDFSWMFCGCSSLTTLDTGGWDTGKVTVMHCMFYGCSSLTTLDTGGWDTGKVTDMYSIFCGCSSLTTLDTGGWDTGKVTDMFSMFYGCSSLTTLDTGGWDTGKVTNMGNMFWSCKSLTTLDVSGWNTESVTNIRGQFGNCWKLEELDMGTWDTSHVTTFYYYPFYNLIQCYSLRKLNIKNWDTTNFNEFQVVVYSEMEELILGEGCGKCKNTMSIDASRSTKWVGPSLTTSLLALYDRKTNGLSDCTIKLSSQSYSALGDDNIATLQTRGYNVTT